MALPVLFSLVFTTPHSSLRSVPSSTGMGGKVPMDFGGAEWSQYLHRCSFSHLIFILNKSLKPWHVCGASAMVFESETVKFEWKSENNNCW